IADRLAKNGWNRKLALRLIEEKKLEGKLFPDTYSVTPAMTETEILTLMHERFKSVWKHIKSASSQKPKLSEHELITLASLVEKETVQPKEAPIIARVFLNRLEKDMKLQSDPTYVYTKERYGKKPTKTDRLTKDNPYNTDVIKGLPPGPIANPGRTALLAAMNPSALPKASSWLYFVAKRDGTGEHYFSRTYKEHRKAIKRYLK
ncbi:MAG: endolytic transglycosylase MltG, partial [Bradymonadia bacterium]